MSAQSVMSESSVGSEKPHVVVYVKTTQDGRKVEVIDGVICLGGVEEARSLKGRNVQFVGLNAAIHVYRVKLGADADFRNAKRRLKFFVRHL